MRSALALAFFLMPSLAFAALPPWAQNRNDLQVMVNFIAQHDDVAETLRLIDMDENAIHYGADCIAYFKRGEIEGEPMPGPAPDLEFHHSTCEIGD